MDSLVTGNRVQQVKLASPLLNPGSHQPVPGEARGSLRKDGVLTAAKCNHSGKGGSGGEMSSKPGNTVPLSPGAPQGMERECF